jgi:hypothetical protein
MTITAFQADPRAAWVLADRDHEREQWEHLYEVLIPRPALERVAGWQVPSVDLNDLTATPSRHAPGHTPVRLP